MNRKARTLDALAGFLASRRRRRHTGPERIGAVLPVVLADLFRQADEAAAQEPQAPPPGAGEKNLAEAGRIILPRRQAKA